MWHAAPWPATRSDLVRALRWLRDSAREHNTALLMTARTHKAAAGGTLAWMSEAYDDAADVRIRVRGRSERHVEVRCRGGKAGRGLLRVEPGDRARVLREPTDAPLALFGEAND
jgi:hypothetical protein